jgi:amidohydrolase
VAAFAADLASLVASANDAMVDLRRDLHRHPELSCEEHRTTEVVRGRMRAVGLAERFCPTPTGAVFELEGGLPGPTVLLRADIDALPVEEARHAGTMSEVPGVMHACGHDAHTSALVGAATVLAARAEDLSGRFVFLFQPAEEGLGGAKAMLDGGVLDGLEPSAVIGCHVTSLGPVGLVAARDGVMMADVNSFSVSAHGAGGHGALAAGGGNVLLAVARAACDLGLAVDGLSFEGTNCSCTAGVLQSGTAPNVIPTDAFLRGTLRTFTPEQSAEAIARLQRICTEAGEAFSCDVRLDLFEHAPAVVNDPAIAAIVARASRAVLGDAGFVSIPPVTPSDDVSEFLNRIPGCYFFVGAGLADGSSGPHHSPSFTIDEGCLSVAASVLAASAVEITSAPSR